MAKRQWSDEDKGEALAALLANGGNIQLTAEQLEIPYSTLRDWSIGSGVNSSVSEIRDIKKGELTERLDQVIETLVGDLLDPIKRADATLKDVATAMGIAIDKSQLLKGAATSRNENVSVTREERIHRISELLNRRGVGDSGSGPDGAGRNVA